VVLLLALVTSRWKDAAGPGRTDPDSLAGWGTTQAGFGPSSTGVAAEAELTNSIGMKLLWIPPGVFLMGSAIRDDDLTGDEKPHRVRIARPFYLSAHEVTVAQFRRFVAATGRQTEAQKSARYNGGGTAYPGLFEHKARLTWSEPGFPQKENHPAVHVSWNDAHAFCQWLSSIEGMEYRLPTEAEWEYACRAGSTTRFSTGDDTRSVRAIANLWEGGPGQVYASAEPRDGFLYTSPVGSFPANDFGLCDMHGNVWEWCADGYRADYYRESPSTDPQGPAEATQRVMRGGSFCLEPRHARCANRVAGPPSFHSYDSGFRVALSPQ
jgi:formylglycine-generating enzyme required for sulfatase activity